MKLRAYAKLNLSLNVVGKRGNLHEIDSVMTSIDIFDEVTLVPRKDKVVTVCGVDGVPTERNTAYKAAVKFAEVFEVCGVDISVVKHIPFGAGMGGSSADAAAVLAGMAELFGASINDDRLRLVATAVGSDVWYMVLGGYARVGGCGEEVQKFASSNGLYYALTTFDFACDTALVYRGYDSVGGDNCNNDVVVDGLQNGCAEKVCAEICNGLQRIVTEMYPYAEPYLSFAESCGFAPTMTGSGSAFFIPFADKEFAEQACKRLCKAGFRTVVCKDVPSGVEVVQPD